MHADKSCVTETRVHFPALSSVFPCRACARVGALAGVPPELRKSALVRAPDAAPTTQLRSELEQASTAEPEPEPEPEVIDYKPCDWRSHPHARIR